MPERTLGDFIMESNAIEGINRMVTKKEHEEAERFLGLERVELEDMIKFVKVYQPNAKLRVKDGLNVRVGRHMPPPGGVQIGYSLCSILCDANKPGASSYQIHTQYELLHPFTDGNGRSGRMLWLWMANKHIGRLPSLSFLHNWYYSSLDNSRE